MLICSSQRSVVTALLDDSSKLHRTSLSVNHFSFVKNAGNSFLFYKLFQFNIRFASQQMFITVNIQQQLQTLQKVRSRPHQQMDLRYIFTAQAMLCAVYSMVVCLCVCLCVSLSQVGVLLKWLNIGTHKQRRTIAQGLQFSDAKSLLEFRTGSPNGGAKCRWGRSKLAKTDAQFLLKTVSGIG